MVELCHLHPFHLEDIVPVELKPFMLHIVQTVESNLCLFLENSIYKILTNKTLWPLFMDFNCLKDTEPLQGDRLLFATFTSSQKHLVLI